MTDSSFEGKTALVTGSTSGIGREVALQLAGGGAHVVVSGRNAERGEAVVDQIRTAGGQATFIAASLGTVNEVRRLANAALSEAEGHIDLLVNNAGIYPFNAMMDVTVDEFDAVYDTNVKAPYFLVAALAPTMIERGEGAIVNLTTMAANFGGAGMSLYGSSKAALQLLTKAWAAELGPSGVRVNAVSPGPTYTPGTSEQGAVIDQVAGSLPSRRASTAAEVADAIVFLLSEAAANIHGAILPVDGGRIAV